MNLTIEGDLAKRLYILLKKDTSLAHALALQWVEKIDATAMYQYLLDRDKVLDLLSAMLQKSPEKTMDDLKILAEGKTPAPVKTAAKKPGRPRKAAAKKPGRPRKASAKTSAPVTAATKKPGRPRKATTPEPVSPAEAPAKKPGRPRKAAAKKPGRPGKAAAKKPGRPGKVQPAAAKKGAPSQTTGKRRRLSAEEVRQAKDKIKSFLRSHPWATRKEMSGVADIPTQAIYRRIITELRTTGEVISRGEKSKAVYALGGAKGAKKNAKK